LPRGPSDIASIDSPDAKQSADQACDIVMVLGPDMLPDFAAALNEAQRRHGGRVLVLDTASQGRNEVRARFHASLKPGARTELFLAFHGQVVDGAHHVQVDGAEERTLDFIDWVRTAPDDGCISEIEMLIRAWPGINA
jgi:predicted molibdopterin-dependent oxidoreductase YjgC